MYIHTFKLAVYFDHYIRIEITAAEKLVSLFLSSGISYTVFLKLYMTNQLVVDN